MPDYSPDYSQYPSDEDVAQLLRSAAYFPADPQANANAQQIAVAVAKQARAEFQSSVGAKAAQAEWENKTFNPFLYQGEGSTPRTYYIDRAEFAQTGVLQLEAGLLSVESVSIGGQILGSSDYIPYPLNAAQKNKAPYWLRFPLARQYRGGSALYPLKIEVTGQWGRCYILPADVWELLQERGALSALRSIENLQNAASFSADGFSKAYDVVGVITQTETVKEWAKDFSARVAEYRRQYV